jgi:hypothetical protein
MAQITAGVQLYYGIETVTTERPGAWVAIPNVTELPELGASPDTLETTSLDNLTYKTYIPGLLDTGGVLSITVNDTAAFRTLYGTMMSAQSGGEATSMSLWFKIFVPSPINRNLAFRAKLSPLGFSGASVNGVLQAKINIVPTGEPTWTTGNA